MTATLPLFRQAFALLSLLLWTCSVTANEALPSSEILGRALPDFELTDFRGENVSRKDFQDSQVLVVAFIGVECPLAQRYTDRLQKISQEYAAQGVKLLMVDPNQQDSLAEMASHARKYKLTAPFVKDHKQELANALGASRTPEVFVFDEQRKIRYFGRIDDQFGVGYVREQPASQELRRAIDQLLASKAVESPHQPAPGCRIGKIKEPATDTLVTYCNQIARIFQEHCVKCHREGEIGPFALTDYNEIIGWAEMIEEVVNEQRMPPWHANPEYGKFSNDCSLSNEQREQITQWVKDGAPFGDANDLPPEKTFVTGWQLPREPDIVFDINPEPYRVPADGEVKYQYFRVDPKFTEDKWISCAQLLPGNRAVVHHILAFARSKGSFGSLEAQRGYLVGYVPGSLAEQYPSGLAKRIPADSELIFQIHYTPIGSEQFDQSRLGIIFANPDEVTNEVRTTSVVQPRLRIPPHEADYRTSNLLPEPLPDCKLLTLAPHMHLRGSAFRYTAVLPDGLREILLDVPRYDFNWQTGYRLADPKPLPKGSKIFCEAQFDNSENNLNNPDPSQSVRWGDQTYDEMMIGYFDIVIPVGKSDTDDQSSSKNRRRELLRQILKQRLLEKLDTNKDQQLQKSEVPERWHPAFELLDTNADSVLASDELVLEN